MHVAGSPISLMETGYLQLLKSELDDFEFLQFNDKALRWSPPLRLYYLLIFVSIIISCEIPRLASPTSAWSLLFSLEISAIFFLFASNLRLLATIFT